MATYKLIQDIEAEDHILGPLSLRQFIYGMVAAFLYYFCFFMLTKGLGIMLVLFLPPALFFTFFAFPFGKDQSTEVWALAKLRFLIKPRRRIWDQSGMEELVTITVPKRVERILTDGLSQGEVKSRLGALASTLDSRGWAVKNVNISTYSYTDPFAQQNSDRLVSMSTMPQEVPTEVYVANDILDETTSPVAQQFETMITQSEKAHRQQIINKMNDISLAERIKPAPQQDYWFMNQPAASALAPNETMFAGSQAVHPGENNTNEPQTSTTAEEQAIIQKAKQRKQNNASTSHLRTLQPLGTAPPPVAQQAPVAPPPTPQIPQADPAIINAYAGNDDLDIATIARQANKDTRNSDDEVVVSLR